MKFVRQVKLRGLWPVGLCLIAMLVVADGSVSAAPLLFVPHSGKFPYHLAGTGGEVAFETLGGTVITAASTDALALVLSATLSNLRIEFLKFKSGFAACGNDGKTATVLINMLAHLGFADPGSKPAELLLVPSGFEYTCAGFVASKIRGSLIGEIAKPALNTASEELGLSFKQTKGEQEFTKFLLGSILLENQFEESSLNGGAFEKMGQSGSMTLKASPGQGTFLLASP